MKSWSGVSGQGRYIALACALVIIGTVFVFMNPYSATGRTLKIAEVSQIAPHLVDDSRVIFIVVVPVSNPSNVPVTITEVKDGDADGLTHRGPVTGNKEVYATD